MLYIIFTVLFFLPFILGFIWLICEIVENYKLCKDKRNYVLLEEVDSDDY